MKHPPEDEIDAIKAENERLRALLQRAYFIFDESDPLSLALRTEVRAAITFKVTPC